MDYWTTASIIETQGWENFLLGYYVLTIALAVSYYLIIPYYIRKKMDYLTESMEVFQYDAYWEIYEIADILNFAERAKKIIQRVRFIKRFGIFWSKKYNWNYLDTSILHIERDILALLNHFKNEFIHEVKEKHEVLTYAKWELTKHLGWSSELSKVSELQKIRLDRQIEQFEELQRVLVKV